MIYRNTLFLLTSFVVGRSSSPRHFTDEKNYVPSVLEANEFNEFMVRCKINRLYEKTWVLKLCYRRYICFLFSVVVITDFSVSECLIRQQWKLLDEIEEGP